MLNNYVVGALKWKGLRLHDTVIAPLTNSEIWLAPREVQSVSVFNPEAGEGEQYLFYRGVAHLDALLADENHARPVQLATPANARMARAPAVVPNSLARRHARRWSHRIPRAACRHSEEGERGKGARRASSDFPTGEYTAAGAAQLRVALKKRALIAQGLYADEAEAMLNTWKASYFQKPGLRVFYIVPREWTDYFLPLEFSVPARVTRVIVGRIDIH